MEFTDEEVVIMLDCMVRMKKFATSLGKEDFNNFDSIVERIFQHYEQA